VVDMRSDVGKVIWLIQRLVRQQCVRQREGSTVFIAEGRLRAYQTEGHGEEDGLRIVLKHWQGEEANQGL
jgi:hypothetical protein